MVTLSVSTKTAGGDGPGHGLDLSVFKDTVFDGECGGKEGSECFALRRLSVALDYYQFLALSPKTAKYGNEPLTTFTVFCRDFYPKRHLLDDYIHWTLYHRDPESIESMKSNLHFVCDSVKRCGATTRHYRDRRVDGDGAEEMESNWFVLKMECLHFNVYHLHELGLRVSTDERTSDLVSNQEEDDDTDLVDVALQRMAKVIESKRALFSTERLDGATNSKFTLQIDEQKESGHGVDSNGMWSMWALSDVLSPKCSK